MSRLNIGRWLILPFLLWSLAGCGGSSSAPTVSGVVAAGSALVGTASLKDSSVPARELSTQIAPDGSFRFDLTGLTAPFVLKATGTANGNSWTLYSFAPSAGVANINPLSHLALVLARGADDLANLYDSPDPTTMNAVKNALATAVAGVQSALRPTLDRFGAAGVNFISDPYVVNHLGLDLLLDLGIISSANGTVVLTDKVSGSSMQAPLGDFMSGSFDFIAHPVTTSGIVRILPGVSTVATGETINFSAFVIGSQSGKFSWSVAESDGGTITGDGVYTAPGKAGSYHVTATSIEDPAKSGTALIVVRAPENIITVVSSVPGEYTVMGTNLVKVSGAEIELTYDTAALANPRITPGALTAGTMFVGNNLYKPDVVKMAFMTISPISGSGPLATIKFNRLGSVTGVVAITKRVIVVAATPVAPGTGGGSDTTTPASGGGSTQPATTSAPGASGSASSGGN